MKVGQWSVYIVFGKEEHRTGIVPVEADIKFTKARDELRFNGPNGSEASVK